MAWENPPLSINDDVHNPHPTSRFVCIGSKNETQNRSPEGKGKPSKSLKGGIHELNNVFTSHICFPHAVRTTLSTPLAHPAIGSTVEIFHLAGQTCRKIAGENFAALSTLHFQPVATKRRRRHPNFPFRRSRARSPTTSEAVERLHFQKKCQMTRAMGIAKTRGQKPIWIYRHECKLPGGRQSGSSNTMGAIDQSQTSITDRRTAPDWLERSRSLSPFH